MRSQQAGHEADSTRADSSLTCDESYTKVDTSELRADQVVELLLSMVGNRIRPETAEVDRG
jgi:cytidylate kinase